MPLLLIMIHEDEKKLQNDEEGESSREHHDLVPKTKRVKAKDGFIQRKDLMQGMKALVGLKVRAIRHRWPCTQRHQPRRGGSRAVTVRLAVRVARKRNQQRQ